MLQTGLCFMFCRYGWPPALDRKSPVGTLDVISRKVENSVPLFFLHLPIPNLFRLNCSWLHWFWSWFIFALMYCPSLLRLCAIWLGYFYGHLAQSRVTWLRAVYFAAIHFRFTAHAGRLETFRSFTVNFGYHAQARFLTISGMQYIFCLLKTRDQYFLFVPFHWVLIFAQIFVLFLTIFWLDGA